METKTLVIDYPTQYDQITARVSEVDTELTGPTSIFELNFTTGVRRESSGHRTSDNVVIQLPQNAVENFKTFMGEQWKLTQDHRVKQFTEESTGRACPSKPRPMSRPEVEFLARMVISELAELTRTVCDTQEEAFEILRGAIGTDATQGYQRPVDEIPLIAEQADALVDIGYYMSNAASKCGMNTGPIFHCVHAANMAKRFPDGKFHRRPEDGKVIKPPNWQEPDVEAVVAEQNKSGSW
jgi:predicted HAD superfamily Cof-like phosphohydrolase